MRYDYIMQVGDVTEYGIVAGGNKIVFIKCGLGGSCMGYEGKYLTMARRLYDAFGCSVIVASNPNDNESHVDRDRAVIERYTADAGIAHPELYFFGHSNGGTRGLELAYAGVSFTKMILVNMPLMINYHKTLRYFAAIPETEIISFYGAFDPSYAYVPYLRGKFENLTVEVIDGADHNFRGMQDEFIGLCDRLLGQCGAL